MNALSRIKSRFYLLLKKLAELNFFDSQKTQKYTNSFKERYPELFQITRLYFWRPESSPKIMSFGCAHGEELFTLRKYFPLSTIIGIEKNGLMRRLCKWRTRSIDVAVYSSIDKVGDPNFELIFALAVLQRTDDHGKEKQVFFFSDFEYWVRKLDEKLVVNGLLVVANADYDLLDTGLASAYEPLDCEGNLAMVNRIMYDKGSVQDPNKTKVFRVFKKVC